MARLPFTPGKALYAPPAAGLGLAAMTQRLDGTVFNAGDCATSRSYYFNHAGEATLLRPTSTANAFRDAETFPLTDYDYA